MGLLFVKFSFTCKQVDCREHIRQVKVSATATHFSPELSDAQISWAKNGVLIQLVEKYVSPFSNSFFSISHLSMIYVWSLKWSLMYNTADALGIEPQMGC